VATAPLKLQHDVAEMLRERHAKTGQRAKVYFASDLDPSGLDLQASWEKALENFGAPISAFVRIALTPAQVKRHKFERFSIEVKASDSRSKSYIEKYGNRCWEADVLPADVIEQELARHIGTWLDRELWLRRNDEIEQARKLL
jgi:hypothetical protein